MVRPHGPPYRSAWGCKLFHFRNHSWLVLDRFWSVQNAVQVLENPKNSPAAQILSFNSHPFVELQLTLKQGNTVPAEPEAVLNLYYNQR